MAAPKKRGLGRGLEDLFTVVEIDPAEREVTTKENKAASVESAEVDGKDEERVQYLDINKIRPNESQPRKSFDEEKLAELAESIVEHGIIQPLVVRKIKNGYEIVAGERRYRASRKAGLKTVPCLVRELNDEENMLLAIIENMQREDLNPIEEAEGLDKMINSFGMTQEQVARSVGKSRPYITNALRLLKLPEAIRVMVINGDISQGHARTLINIEDQKKQMVLANRAKDEGLSVRILEQLAGEVSKTTKKPGKSKRKKNPDLIRVEEELKRIVGTKVNIVEKGNKGKVEIEYFNREELERLIELIRSWS